MDEKSVSDIAQLAADNINVSVVSGLAGRLFAHSTRKDKNFKQVTVTKMIIKVRVKKIINLAKFLTF